MARSLAWITDDAWPSDEGWPYPDDDAPADEREELVDVDADCDDDVVSLHAAGSHLLDRLSPLEREVVAARYGLDGRGARTVKQLSHELGVPRSDLRDALGGGLAKLRTTLG